LTSNRSGVMLLLAFNRGLTNGRPTIRSSIRHAGPDGSENPRLDGATARLWHRPPHRTGRPGVAGAQPGDHLSRAGPARIEGLDQQRLGDEREQPARPVLRDHPVGQEAAGRRSRKLGADRRSRESPARGPVVTLQALRSRFCGLVFKRRHDARLNEEIRTHLDLLTAENIARGLSPAAAQQAALREFGGVEYTKELTREERGLPFIESLLQDARFALRQLRHTPSFAITAMLTLAIGIGGTSAIFS